MVLELAFGAWRAKIAPEAGGNVMSLQCGGQDVLAPERASNAEIYLVGSPMLLPANRTAGGRFCFEGHSYSLPVNEPKSGANLHGQMCRAAFRVAEYGGTFAHLVYENRGEIYPFPFRMDVVYALSDKGFAAEYNLTNLSGGAMPYSFGLHTTFVEPALFSVPLKEQQERDALNLPTGRYLPLDAEEEAYCRGAHSRGRVISGYYSAAGNTARIGNYGYRVEGFDHWILYNARGEKGILCVEPQKGGVNALNLPDCPTVPANGTAHFGTYLSYQG